jgi:hypothetical protein
VKYIMSKVIFGKEGRTTVINHPLRFVVIAAMTIAFVLSLGSATGAWAQEGSDTVFVISPAHGATVSGLITITGAVSFPDFLKYEILLRPSKGELKWVATVYAPVIDGNLARFDTRTYLDGTYQMIIRQVHPDSNYTDWNGPTITIDNQLGAPLPYPEIEPSYLYAPEKYALVRLRNCSGATLDFDYISPDGGNNGELQVAAKGQDTTYCPFEDFVLSPGEYRGTATGGGEQAYSYSFQAEASKVYELIYNGQGAGRFQLVINQVEGDERASSDKAGSGTATEVQASVAAIAEPAPAVVKESVPAAAPAEPPPAPVQSQSVLPVTGKGDLPKLPFILMGLALVLFVVGGGILAMLWRKGFSS